MVGDNPEELLRGEAQARLAAVVESSDDAIVSKTLEGIIVSWNTGAQRIFGYTPDEVIGKSITILIPPDRLDEEPRILQRICRGERVEHFETIRMTKDGRLLNVSVTISPVRDARGRVVGASKIARDITPQIQVREDLRAAKEAAEAASRAKDLFLSVLSHELRTPLTPVLGAISYIEQHPVLSADDVRHQISMIRRNVETQARLVDDLLDLTKIARGKVQLHFEVLDAHTVVRTALATVQKDIDQNRLALTTGLRALDHHTWADAARLQQVLMNILSNAVKFTPPGGSIELRTGNEGNKLRIEVKDSGVGIEPEVLPRLFQAFEQGENTVTRRYGGLGLGLSIVKSLIELHSGTVSVLSGGKDQGATVTITLGTVAPIAARPVEPGQRSAPCSGKVVLLVEDHLDTREVMARLLGSLGCTVRAVGTVREALELADRERFDLLVSDIGLPDGSGFEVMQHMSARQPIRGIAISGFGQDDDVRRSRAAGFETHLIKPISFQALEAVILKMAG